MIVERGSKNLLLLHKMMKLRQQNNAIAKVIHQKIVNIVFPLRDFIVRTHSYKLVSTLVLFY